jgi:hypothetical protein
MTSWGLTISAISSTRLEEIAVRIALLIRTRVGVATDIHPAVPWDGFLESVDALARGEFFPHVEPADGNAVLSGGADGGAKQSGSGT